MRTSEEEVQLIDKYNSMVLRVEGKLEEIAQQVVLQMKRKQYSTKYGVTILTQKVQMI